MAPSHRSLSPLRSSIDSTPGGGKANDDGRAQSSSAARSALRLASGGGEVSMGTWGIVPAAGRGSRIQPLAFSKELLPVGSRNDGREERPLAVSEYIVERMLLAGVEK